MNGAFDDLITLSGIPVVLYASDGVSSPVQTTAIITNARNTELIGTTRSETIQGYLPSSVQASAGQILQVQDAWYVVVKPLVQQGWVVDMGTILTMLALPYLAIVQRPTAQPLPTAQRNAYGEPLTPPTPAPPVPTTQWGTIRVGYANHNHRDEQTDMGQRPAGSVTLIAPLGSDVLLGDELALTTGQRYTVTQVNQEDANSTSYALQLIVTESSGANFLYGSDIP